MADSSDPTSQQQETTQEDLDVSLEADVNADAATQPDAMNLDGANDTSTADPLGVVPETAEPRIPAKKDATLREFLNKMDEYAPIVCSTPTPTVFSPLSFPSEPPSELNTNPLQIPDAVTNYYMTLAGLPPPPQTSLHLSRLLALATQKFIADIAADAYQYARIRASNTSSNPMGATTAALPGAAGAPAAGANPGGKEAPGKGANLGVQRPGFGGGGQGGGQGRTVLTMEDLGMAVGEYGVNIRRGEFYR